MKDSIESKEVPQLILSEPTPAIKNSFLEAAEEFGAANEWKKDKVEYIKTHFNDRLQRFKSDARGEGLEEGHVSQFTFWLIDGDKYIGSIRIRPQLTESLKVFGGNIGYDIRPSERNKGYATQLLKLGLEKAAQLGLHEVLLTCDEDNIGSQKTIEANGGELIETNVHVQESMVSIRKYKITLKA